MQLRRLKLKDFRNYEKLDVSFPPGIVLLSGPNGAGKTNLLEAVHYLSYLNSFRAARDREVVRNGAPFAVIEAQLADDAGRPFDARLVMRGGKRHVRLNGDNITRFQDFIGRLHSQFFFPRDLSLITGDPVLRRAMLDLELLRLRPALTPVYRAFQNALKERNRTLKLLFPQPGERRDNSAELERTLAAYTEQLVTTGAQIMRERRGLVHVVDEHFTPLYAAMTAAGDESVSLRYLSAVPLEPDEDVARSYRGELESAKETEASLRFTTVGPHRDDLGFVLNRKRDLRRYGSQGQQRSATLALRLALCALSLRRLGDSPLLLLDDALSELDDGRKQQLLQLSRKHRQVFITSASDREVDLVAPHAQAVFRVTGAQVGRLTRD